MCYVVCVCRFVFADVYVFVCFGVCLRCAIEVCVCCVFAVLLVVVGSWLFLCVFVCGMFVLRSCLRFVIEVCVCVLYVMLFVLSFCVCVLVCLLFVFVFGCFCLCVKCVFVVV